MKSHFVRGVVLTGVVLVVFAAFVIASRAPKSPRRPDILLLTLDTTRADHTSVYGYRRPTTPRLARLARDGVRFEAAYAPMSTTLPSHATMFTGELPRKHGLTKNGAVLPDGWDTLAEQLQRAGYRTAAFVSSFPLERRFGLAQGFDVYDDDFRGGECLAEMQEWEGFDLDAGFCRNADRTTDRALEWLEQEGYLDPKKRGYLAGKPSPRERPFFLWVHYFDPHAPWETKPNAIFRPQGTDWLAEKKAAYDGEIRFMDTSIGAILDALQRAGRLDDTLVVVAADHGEGLMQHGHMHHNIFLYEEDVRVPFLFRWPGKIAPGRVVREPVQVADVSPTLLALAGIAPSTEPGTGEALAAALLQSAPLDADRPVFLQRRIYEETEHMGFPLRGEKLGVRLGRWKYIEALDEGTIELYDLKADPEEKRNVAELHPEERAKLAAALHRWRESTPPPALPEVDPEAAKKLRALGYVP